MTAEGPPAAGTVLRYRCLRRREAEGGDHRGHEDRPVTIVLSRTSSGDTIVVPITHSEPLDPATSLEVPEEERRAIGLDDERSGVVLSEFNAFLWPGPDLSPVPKREPETFVYGHPSKAFFGRVLFQVQVLIRAKLVERVQR